MNFTHFIEYVQQHHGDIGDKELRLLLNQSADDFCRRSEIFKAVFSTASVAGQRYYQLPSTPIKVLRVQINDVQIPRLIGSPIIDDDEFGVTATDVTEDVALSTPSSSSDARYWYMDLDRLAIVEKATNAITRDGKTSDYQSMSESGKEIRLYSISTPTHFLRTDSYSDESSALFGQIPAMFHEALVYKVIARLYEGQRNMNIDLANRFDSKYLELLNEAKKYGRSNKIHTGFVKGCHF